jgi:hypothetical protein
VYKASSEEGAVSLRAADEENEEEEEEGAASPAAAGGEEEEKEEYSVEIAGCWLMSLTEPLPVASIARTWPSLPPRRSFLFEKARPRFRELKRISMNRPAIAASAGPLRSSIHHAPPKLPSPDGCSEGMELCRTTRRASVPRLFWV